MWKMKRICQKLYVRFIRKKRSKSNHLVKEEACHYLDEIFTDIDWSDIPQIGKLNEANGNRKTIGLMDDVDMTAILYDLDFKKLKAVYQKDVLKDFNIITAFGKDCGLTLYKYAIVEKKPLDIAFLDITIGYGFRSKSGKIIDIDGIDIAIELLKLNPNIQIWFVTAHSLHKDKVELKEYFDKFEKSTGRKIDRHYIDKNYNREISILKALYEEDRNNI